MRTEQLSGRAHNTAAPKHAGNGTEGGESGGRPPSVGSGGPFLTWLAEGRPSLRSGHRVAGIHHQLQGAVHRPGHQGPRSTPMPSSRPWRATPACVWVSKGREGDRLLGTRFVPFPVRDQPQAGISSLTIGTSSGRRHPLCPHGWLSPLGVAAQLTPLTVPLEPLPAPSLGRVSPARTQPLLCSGLHPCT